MENNKDLEEIEVIRKKLYTLIDASLFSLGWIVGKSGQDADPVYPLAKALESAGVRSSHVSSVIQRAEGASSNERS